MGREDQVLVLPSIPLDCSGSIEYATDIATGEMGTGIIPRLNSDTKPINDKEAQ